MNEPETIRVLVVDDGEAQRLSLSVLLGEIGIQPVMCASGRDALRRLLEQDFALILLDVNMPGLDGFETAELIRTRPANALTPIIFLTAYHDDAYRARGYALGAVDYILSPVQPDVLQAKVSVFVELYRKTEEIRRQREALRGYAEQLRELGRASLALNSAVLPEDVLQTTTANAAAIIGAQQASTSAALQDGTTVLTVTRLGEKYGNSAAVSSHRLGAPIALSQPVRLAVEDPRIPGLAPTAVAEGVALRGWLAAPMTARDGRIIGLVQLSEKSGGEFTAEDEGILVQLAQMAAVAIDNLWAAEAREANRLKDEFLSVLSHELRTPMQAILTWISILRRDGIEPALTGRGLDAMERSARAQTRLVEDLLDISRIIRGELRIEQRRVDLAQTITFAVDALKPAAAAKSIDLVCTVPAEIYFVSGDAARLQQVMLNLLSNAVKFTPEQGRIVVRLTATNMRYVIQVCDSGPGIPVAFLPYVFDRFRQADSTSARRHGGLGLGLAIVRHLVELHGGVVQATNAAGAGAVLTVELPVSPGQELRSAPVTSATMSVPLLSPADPSNGVRLDGIRVMLVEDEAAAREGFATALRFYGADVVAVGTAAAALAALKESAPHVLLSDLGMPDMDGFGLIRAVRALENGNGRVPAAAITAYVRPEDRAAALAAGFDTHVQKPVEPLVLAQVVQQLVRRAAM